MTNLKSFMKAPQVFSLFFIVALTFSVFNAFAAIPDQTIDCKATIFPSSQALPLIMLSPAKISLDPTSLEASAKFELHEIEYKSKYEAFYSPYAISPRSEQTKWEANIITSEKPIEKGKLELILRRFDAKPDRIAAMSLDIKLEGSFNASYLIDPNSTGSNLWVTIPKKIGTESTLLSVACEVH